MELILVRHGEPDAGPGGRVDPPLTKRGLKQAERAGRYLAEEPIARVYASPLRRAHQTAERVRAHLDCPLEVVEGLSEADAYAEDARYVRIEELRRDPATFSRFLADPLAFLGADERAFRTAVVAAFAHIVEAAAGARVAVVSHGLPMNLLLASVIGVDSLTAFAPAYASVSRVRVGPERRFVLSVNETAHLREAGETVSTFETVEP